ncbi:MAG: BirA family biotin operon repressor/biotin-[acetyl-CoA-carboxylase] ligase [Arenicella sp.]|jgi:BirA family biotin operon repressor/biotin-[acetyl-CoA-carboxylase] ligase
MIESHAPELVLTPKLDRAVIQTFLTALGQNKVDSIEVLQSVDSTNSHLLEQQTEIGRARICAAEIQSSGRGRRGNEWLSAPHQNIMLSLSWGFSHWPKSITGLGLAVALVITERLNQDFDLDVKIKWPNDLLIDDLKLAGILIDVAGEAGGVCSVVVGLGLNVHQPDWSSSDGAYAWQDLHSLGIQINRNEFIAKLVNDLLGMLSGFELHGFAPLAPIWNQHSSYTGKTISVGNEGDQVVGEMQGVDRNGALIVKDAKGDTHFFSESNVSVRLVV